MPSRQRVSTRSEGSTSTPARAAVPSQRTSTHNPPKPAPSPYRTRHRRVVRGPELAEREGGAQDLVPPSDDEEYDEWRAVRAVARVQDDEHGYQAELALEPEQVRALVGRGANLSARSWSLQSDYSGTA